MNERRIEALRRLPGFASLPRRAVRSLAEQFELVDVEAGVRLLPRGARVDWVFLVADGRVALMHGSRAHRVLEPGDLFGTTEALTLRRTPSELRSLTNATLLVMERRRFVTVLATVPAFALLVLRGIAAGVPTGADRRRRGPAHDARLVTSSR